MSLVGFGSFGYRFLFIIKKFKDIDFPYNTFYLTCCTQIMPDLSHALFIAVFPISSFPSLTFNPFRLFLLGCTAPPPQQGMEDAAGAEQRMGSAGERLVNLFVCM